MTKNSISKMIKSCCIFSNTCKYVRLLNMQRAAFLCYANFCIVICADRRTCEGNSTNIFNSIEHKIAIAKKFIKISNEKFFSSKANKSKVFFEYFKNSSSFVGRLAYVRSSQQCLPLTVGWRTYTT